MSVTDVTEFKVGNDIDASIQPTKGDVSQTIASTGEQAGDDTRVLSRENFDGLRPVTQYDHVIPVGNYNFKKDFVIDLSNRRNLAGSFDLYDLARFVYPFITQYEAYSLKNFKLIWYFPVNWNVKGGAPILAYIRDPLRNVVPRVSSDDGVSGFIDNVRFNDIVISRAGKHVVFAPNIDNSRLYTNNVGSARFYSPGRLFYSLTRGVPKRDLSEGSYFTQVTMIGDISLYGTSIINSNVRLPHLLTKVADANTLCTLDIDEYSAKLIGSDALTLPVGIEKPVFARLSKPLTVEFEIEKTVKSGSDKSINVCVTTDVITYEQDLLVWRPVINVSKVMAYNPDVESKVITVKGFDEAYGALYFSE